MATLETVRLLTLRAQTQGYTEAERNLKGLEQALSGVRVQSENTDRASLSAERSFNRLARSVDPVRKAVDDYSRAQTTVQRAVAQGVASQEEANRVLAVHEQRVIATASGLQKGATANDNFAKSTGLAKHELSNLSAQLQDVFVSLQGGASPFTVLTQQGGQIASVFTGTNASLGSVIAQLGKFALMAAPVAAVGAAVLEVASAWSRYDEAQRAVTVSLAGLGRQSGVTRDQINGIAESTASSANVSISSAREMASAFTATGKIGSEVFPGIIKVAKDFAFTTGQELPDATKQLAQAFADPVKGAELFASKLGALDSAQIANIKNLEAAGQHLAAQKALLTALPPALAKAEESTSAFAKAWEAVKSAVEAADNALGKAMSGAAKGETPQQMFDRLTAEKAGAAANNQMTPFGLNVNAPTLASTTPPTRASDIDLRLAGAGAAIESDQLIAARKEADALAAAEEKLARSIRETEGAFQRQIASIQAVTEADRALITAENAMADAEARGLSLIEQVTAGARAGAIAQAEIAAEITKSTEALKGQETVIQAEIDSLNMSKAARNSYMATVKAEVELKQKGIDLTSQTAQNYIREAQSVAELQNALERATAAQQANTAAVQARTAASAALQAAVQAETNAYFAASNAAGMSPIGSNWNENRNAGSYSAATPQQQQQAQEQYGGHGTWQLTSHVGGGTVQYGAIFVPDKEGMDYFMQQRSGAATTTTSTAPTGTAANSNYAAPSYSTASTSTGSLAPGTAYYMDSSGQVHTFATLEEAKSAANVAAGYPAESRYVEGLGRLMPGDPGYPGTGSTGGTGGTEELLRQVFADSGISAPEAEALKAAGLGGLIDKVGNSTDLQELLRQVYADPGISAPEAEALKAAGLDSLLGGATGTGAGGAYSGAGGSFGATQDFRPDAYALQNPEIYYGTSGNIYGQTTWVDRMSEALAAQTTETQTQTGLLQTIASSTSTMAAALSGSGTAGPTGSGGVISNQTRAVQTRLSSAGAMAA